MLIYLDLLILDPDLSRIVFYQSILYRHLQYVIRFGQEYQGFSLRRSLLFIYLDIITGYNLPLRTLPPTIKALKSLIRPE